MTRLRGPAPDSWSFLLVGGGLFRSAGGLTGVAYAGLTGSTLADIRVDDGTDTPGAPFPGSAVTIDSATSAPPLFWFPDGDVPVVYMSVNGGPRTPVYANYSPRIDAKVGKGDLLLNVADYGIKGDGTDETTAINAFFAGNVVTGATVLFPRPTGAYYLISDAIAVRTPGITIRGEHRTVEIRQQTWNKAGFDILDTDGVTVQDLTLNYTGATRTEDGTSFRASSSYTFSAGVWSNSNYTTLRNLHVIRFAMGCFFSAYDTGTLGYLFGHHSNRVIDCEFESIDHGVLANGQRNLEIRGLYTHDHLDATAGGNPTHAIYVSGQNYSTLPGCENLTVADCRSEDNLWGAAYKFMYIKSGTITNMQARNTGGLFRCEDIEDVTITGASGAAMNMDGYDPATNDGSVDAVSIVSTTGNTRRSRLSNITVDMASNGRAFILQGDDCHATGVTVAANHEPGTAGASAVAYSAVHLRGTRSTISGLKVIEKGTPGLPIMVGWASGTATANCAVRDFSCYNTQGLASVNGTNTTGTVLEYNPAEQYSISGSTWVQASAAAATWTQTRREHTRTTVLTGATLTITPNLALETHSLADVQTTSAITVANPVSTAQKDLRHTVVIANNSGATMPAVTWGSKWKLANSFNPPPPGSTNQLTFTYDGTDWREVARSVTAGAALSRDGYLWLPADHNLLAWSVQPELCNASTVLPTAGLLTLTRVHLPSLATVTNVLLYAATAGSALTAGQCFAALYRSNGTLVAQTADQATAWASVGLKEMPLAGGPYSLTAGDYYVGWWFNGTTGPALARVASIGSALANAKLTSPNLRFATADTGVTATAPATFGAQTGINPTYWAALS